MARNTTNPTTINAAKVAITRSNFGATDAVPPHLHGRICIVHEKARCHKYAPGVFGGRLLDAVCTCYASDSCSWLHVDGSCGFILGAGAALASGAAFGLELVDEIDGGEEAPARSGSDAASRDGDGQMRLAGAGRDSDAGIPASEETIYYAFHPLAGRTVASSGRRVVLGGDVHLTIRLDDGTLTLTPEWMLRPAAAACEIRLAPRLCLARLRDLRAYLDAVLGSDHGDSPLIMRLNRRQPDLFEEPPRLRPIPNERRRAMVESVRALLAEALSQEVSSSIRKEARHEPDQG